MAYGWISIHRKILDNWIWEDEVFSRGQAWIDLILLANHEDRKVMFNGSLLLVKRGSKVTSLTKLAERWKWSRKKVKKFMELLENDGMITFESDNKKTTYTICNYNVYQNEDITKRTAEEPQRNIKRTSKEHQKNTNNNINNINNDNNDNNNTVDKPNPIPYKEIISYLNEKTGNSYKHSANKNQSLIKARWNEGNRLDDFKKVIDNKSSEWLGDEKMNKYLRPSTLFGSKFDEYRNQTFNSKRNNINSIGDSDDQYRTYAQKAMQERVNRVKNYKSQRKRKKPEISSPPPKFSEDSMNKLLEELENI